MEGNMFTEDGRHFIGLLQDTINRMANNSANCKNWLFVLVTAIIAFVAEHQEASNILWVLLVVDVLFYVLDAYYLRLENNFRDVEKNFVTKCKSSYTADAGAKDQNKKQGSELSELDKALYDFNYTELIDPDTKEKVDKKNCKKALKSPSTWPFYTTIAFVIIIMIGVLQEWHPFQAICDFISHCHCGCDCSCK